MHPGAISILIQNRRVITALFPIIQQSQTLATVFHIQNRTFHTVINILNTRPCFVYRCLVTRLQRLFKFVRDDVVNDGSGYNPSLLLTHVAQGVRAQEWNPGLVPPAVVDVGFFHVLVLFDLLPQPVCINLRLCWIIVSHAVLQGQFW